MEIRRYCDSDYATISSWYRERNMIPVPKDILPPTGAIVEDIGAAYLCFTDSNLAFLEGFITNPNSTRKQRIEALDKIVAYFLHLSKERGCRGAFIMCQHPTISEKAKQSKFNYLGEHKMYFREL